MSYKVIQLSDSYKNLVASVRHSAINLMLDSNVDRDLADHLLCKLYKENKAQWIVGYDIARYLPGVYQLAFSDEVIDAVINFGLKNPVFTASKIPLRCDMPFDERFDFPWHQDYAYNLGSSNSVTVWIPLQDTLPQNGALELIEGDYFSRSLRNRLLPFNKQGTLSEEQVNLLLSETEGNQIKTVPVNAGSVFIFNQFIIHRSGRNISSTPRLSLQVRFSDLDDPFFKQKNFLFSDTHDIFNFHDALVYIG